MVEYKNKVLEEKEARFFSNCECAVHLRRSRLADRRIDSAFPCAGHLSVKLSSWRKCTRTVHRDAPSHPQSAAGACPSAGTLDLWLMPSQLMGGPCGRELLAFTW